MKIFWTLARRELAAFFCSITGYVIIAAVTFLIGLSFVVLMTNLGSDPSPMPVTEMFYRTYFFWLIVLLATPVSDLQVVTAKFASSLLFYIVLWLPMLVCLFVVRHFTNQPGTLDSGTIGGMYLGVFLVGGLFLSLGCFASSLTRSQMAAAMISFVMGVSLFALGFLAAAIPAATPWQSQVLSYFNLFEQMHDFARGVVDTRAVIFYASLTFFFLFLTLRVVESRRWK